MMIPDATATLWRVNFHHISCHCPATSTAFAACLINASRPVPTAVVSITELMALLQPDARIEPRQKDVGDHGADERQQAQHQDATAGEVHVLRLQRDEQLRP